MPRQLSLVIFSLFLGLGFAQAQNQLLALPGKGAASEERLLYKKPAGDYEITIDGERLLERTYFRLDIQKDGQAIPEHTKVELTLTPPKLTGIAPSTHTANYDGERFLVDTIKLETSADWGDENWFVTITINDEATTTFGTLVYPPKPEQNLVFSFINIALPLIALVIFTGIYALRGVRLEQAASA